MRKQNGRKERSAYGFGKICAGKPFLQYIKQTRRATYRNIECQEITWTLAKHRYQFPRQRVCFNFGCECTFQKSYLNLTITKLSNRGMKFILSPRKLSKRNARMQSQLLLCRDFRCLIIINIIFILHYITLYLFA